METVSIVIPTYNRSSLLKRSVESLLAQTHSDLEILIIDDGSTDNTGELVRGILADHKNVKYYLRPHLGAPAARNFGLEQAKGEFIGFFDSDDLWPADFIRILAESLKANPHFDAVYSKIILLIDGQLRGQHGSMPKHPSGSITMELFTGKPFILPSCVIFRRSAWDGIFWDEALMNRQDFDVFLRISTRIKFKYVPEVYVMKHRGHDSIGTDAERNLTSQAIRVMERFYFLLDGRSCIPRRFAFNNISHCYRRFGLEHYKKGNKSASISHFKKALSYCPFDLRLYPDLFRAILLDSRKDKQPDWKHPPPFVLPAKL